MAYKVKPQNFFPFLERHLKSVIPFEYSGVILLSPCTGLLLKAQPTQAVFSPECNNRSSIGWIFIIFHQLHGKYVLNLWKSTYPWFELMVALFESQGILASASIAFLCRQDTHLKTFWHPARNWSTIIQCSVNDSAYLYCVITYGNVSEKQRDMVM